MRDDYGTSFEEGGSVTDGLGRLGLIALLVGACDLAPPVVETPETEGSSTTGVNDTGTTWVDTSSGLTADGTSTGISETDGGMTTEATGASGESGTASTGEEPICGDGIMAGDEDCDGLDLMGATCQTLGLGEGALACTASCDYDASGCMGLPAAPVLMLAHSPIKQFDFSWAAAPGVDHYELEERATPGEPFVPLGGDVVGEAISHSMPLHLRHQAGYRLRACIVAGCTDSAVVDVTSSMAEAVGYLKASLPVTGDQLGFDVALSADGNTLVAGAFEHDDPADDAGAVYVFARDGVGVWSQQALLMASNAGMGDRFGASLVLSADGNTLAVGADLEDSNATGIGGNEADDSAFLSGAVYVFVRDGMGGWSQQAYVKASNTDTGDYFGTSLALSYDGNTLAVGAMGEDGNATGIGGDQANDSASGSGAAYVFVRDGMGAWSQQAYVKASNTDASDAFGQHLALSGDGTTLAVGAYLEDSGATGIDGSQANDGFSGAGAVYVFVYDGMGSWSQQAYVKASNTGTGDWFGWRAALSETGDTLAVSAFQERSDATGVGGNQASDAAFGAGAAYVFVRDGAGAWSQQAYVKASNTQALDNFGWGLSLSGDGNVLAAGSLFEASSATGVGGNQAGESMASAGAVYVYTRDGVVWFSRSYVKAPNTDAGDIFGASVALSDDGHTLAVGAYGEDSSATGVGGDQTDDATPSSGAVYLY